MRPYYIARAIGGLLFLIGAIVGSYNIWMTIRTGSREVHESVIDMPSPVLGGTIALQPGE
jgi:cytochrome c oxidase cbb3-type subunit 1